MTSEFAPPLTALGGIPILSIPHSAASTSYNAHTSINLARLLDRLEAQLKSETQTSNNNPVRGASAASKDAWQAAAIAIALTHATSAIDDLQKATGSTAEVARFRSRLQSARRQYVQLDPLQPSLQSQSSIGESSFDTRDYLLQDVAEESDDDSEFEERDDEMQVPAPAKNAKVALGGVAKENGDRAISSAHDGLSEKVRDDDDEAGLDEYMTKDEAREAKARSDDEKTATKSEEVPPTELMSERTVQDSLSAELLRMASVLKVNSLRFADALERDRKLLENADEKLQGNLTLMTRTRGRLGEYSRKVRSMGWITLGAVTMVAMTWMVMFVVIRLT